MSILVFIQQENGKINRLSKEAIAGAQQLGEALEKSVSVCVFNETSANELTGLNLEKVILLNNEKLNDYNPLEFANISVTNIVGTEVYNEDSPCFRLLPYSCDNAHRTIRITT